MKESVLTSPVSGLAVAMTRTLRRFRAALAAALTRADDCSVDPHWIDGMPSRAKRIAEMQLGDVRRSAVFDEWLTWRQ